MARSARLLIAAMAITFGMQVHTPSRLAADQLQAAQCCRRHCPPALASATAQQCKCCSLRGGHDDVAPTSKGPLAAAAFAVDHQPVVVAASANLLLPASLPRTHYGGAGILLTTRSLRL